ncbi:uncharacterized protein BJ212DRAFT_1484125 [Suillus subaureus]|uniref:Uncharacterized protein n=1 Tax=Suillus subaureus TaxID=48587 RepID=A0A9P7E3Y7_9AGAM|nr:uncharacterized protein BJ212DRAFT_1484125 [Suillus subaureus]KAG1810554.1 hypothetical protein BJ212DRAFT_1484125 [Suillus subaureus]
MPGNSETRYIRFEIINGNDLRVPSERISSGIYVSINVDSRRCWKSAIKVLSSDRSVVWGDIVTLSSHVSPALSIEIRASYEADRMLGSGEVIGNFKHRGMSYSIMEMSHSVNISFPSVHGIHPSLTLKATVVHAYDNQNGALSDMSNAGLCPPVVNCEVTRDTDAGHAQFAKYVTGKAVSHLNDAVEHFQLVLDQCPVSHPDRAAALTNLAWARLVGYIQNDLEDIDTTTSLFRDALALRPQCHLDHPISLYNLTKALTWRRKKKRTAADIRESAQLYHELLPLCPEGTYLRSIVAGQNGVDYVINRCDQLPKDASDEGIHLRRVILELCPPGHQLRPRVFDELAQAVEARFDQYGNIDDLDMSIQFGREALSLCPEGHSDRDYYLNNLAFSLDSRFDHQGKPNDLDEAIFFIDDITRAVSLYHEALTLRPPGHPTHNTTLNNLALALSTRYNKLHVSKDLDEAIDRYRECLRLRRLGNPGSMAILLNLSSALCSCFMHTQENEDVEEAITLC